MMNIERMKVECPFCGKLVVEVIHYLPILQTATSRTSAKSVTKFYRTKEKYEVQSPCPNCGKSVKQIQEVLNEGKKDVDKEKKIMKRLKEQGLDFSNIVTKI